MRKLAVPIHLNTITENSLPTYLEMVKACGAERVFICGFGEIYREESVLYTDTDRVKKSIRFFKDNGFETAVWVNSFGHGILLTHNSDSDNGNQYTKIEGVNGDYVHQVYCPMDEKFAADYSKGIRKLASLGPDIIMLDDDFRINTRDYYMGCFCPLHLKEYYKRIGEEVPREELERLVFTGGKNKYRSAYMELLRDTLLDFAKMLRAAVDEVNPTIRLGASTTHDNWDYSGTDAIEIARAFAGNTEPFVRTAGAPYWKENLSRTIESTRMQIQWCNEADIEVFTEGDVYPRPRYNVPSRQLELFDLALIADGKADGILKYIFDYAQKPEYETGYIERHIKYEKLREELENMFVGKTTVGVRVFNEMHRIENLDLPTECEDKIAKKLTTSYKSVAGYLLAANGIPTVYEDSEYPAYICGENAKYISEQDLKNGAILDALAAKILMTRGVDTGLLEEETACFAGEYFANYDDTIRNINKKVTLKRVKCSDKAEVLSVFLPDGTPAAYTYENEQGLRFLVLSHDLYGSKDNANYFNNYYKQEQVIQAIEWAGRKKLPVASYKNPCLYMITAKNADSMAVAVFNIFMDEIPEPVIFLDDEYQRITCLNCTGQIEKNKVCLSEMAPFGFAAFEVKK